MADEKSKAPKLLLKNFKKAINAFHSYTTLIMECCSVINVSF